MKNKQSVPVLIPFLILVSMLFIGILIFAYVETKKANPKMIEVGAVGRTPWSARVPLDPLLAVESNFHTEQADEAVGCGPGGPPHHHS